MSCALENKHKQSRENIEKINNNLGKAKKPWENQKKRTKKHSSRLPHIFFGLFLVLLFFWFSQVFLAFPRLLLVFSMFLVFFSLFRSICVITISFNLQVCEPKSHLKAYVICSYNESV